MPRYPRKNIVVQPGDVTRRVADSYISECFRGDPVYDDYREFLRLIGPTFDYLLEKSKGLVDNVNINLVPIDFLGFIGANLGYEFKLEQDLESQRGEIAKLSDVYKRRGSSPTVKRVVLQEGGTFCEVRTPYYSLFRVSDVASTLSGPNKIEDAEFWRWGTYEVVSDLPISEWGYRLGEFHPAGTRIYSRVEFSYSLDEELPPEPDVDFDVDIDYPLNVVLELENSDTDSEIPIDVDILTI